MRKNIVLFVNIFFAHQNYLRSFISYYNPKLFKSGYATKLIAHKKYQECAEP